MTQKDKIEALEAKIEALEAELEAIKKQPVQMHIHHHYPNDNPVNGITFIDPEKLIDPDDNPFGPPQY